MKYDNSCLSLGMGRIGGAGTTDEIDCFIPQQTPGKVRREMGFSGKLSESLPQQGE